MLYVGFALSLRNVKDLLHERGIEVSHGAVRFWWQRFGPKFAAEIRRKRGGQLQSTRWRWRWHLDEVFVKVNGEQHYLWRVVDHEGDVLESYVTKTRDRAAALKFLKKLMKRHGQPGEIVTDKLRSYGAALKDLGIQEKQVTGHGGTTAPRTRTSRSDDASGRCYGSGARKACRRSSPSTTSSIRNGASHAATSIWPHGPPLSPSGGSSAPPELGRTCRMRHEFASV